MEAEEVERWISSNEICVEAEEDIFKIIQKWIEQNESDRKAKFEELFRHLRLGFVSRDFLLVDIVTNQLVRDNYSCLKRVSDAIALVSYSSEDALMKSPESPRRRLGTHAIVACGGKYVYCYLPEKNEWKFMTYGACENQTDCSTQMIVFRDQLFTFEAGLSRRAERYDPVFDSWSTMQRFQLFSRSARVAVVRGQIYAIAVDRSTNKSTIERYSVGSCSWEKIFTCHEGCRDYSCVVAAGDCMYVLGGESSQRGGGDYIAKAERFDTVHNKWEEIADMQQERGYAFGVATQGKIFVAGRKGKGGKQLNSCEVYNISTNEWQFIRSLKIPRSWGSIMCVNGTLYVLGGLQSYTVESYDPRMNEWIQKTSIPEDKFYDDRKPSFKGCALKLSKGVLNKLK